MEGKKGEMGVREKDREKVMDTREGLWRGRIDGRRRVNRKGSRRGGLGGRMGRRDKHTKGREERNMKGREDEEEEEE